MGQQDELDGRVRRGQESREARRVQIKERALEVFSERGYHDTSVSHVVKAAGVARGTFYLYFDSKDAIFLERLDDLRVHLRKNIVGVDLSSASPPLDVQLCGTIVRILRTVVSNRPLTRIIFREAVGLHDTVDARLREFDDDLHAYVMKSLRAGIDSGLISEGVVPEVSAACVVGSLREVVNRWVVVSDAEFDMEQVASAMLVHHLGGLLPRG